jgi:hypothetical protein
MGRNRKQASSGRIRATISQPPLFLQGIEEESHLVKLVQPFVGGKRAEITSTPKIFFLDNGLRNFLFGGFTNEMELEGVPVVFDKLIHAHTILEDV